MNIVKLIALFSALFFIPSFFNACTEKKLADFQVLSDGSIVNPNTKEPESNNNGGTTVKNPTLGNPVSVNLTVSMTPVQNADDVSTSACIVGLKLKQIDGSVFEATLQNPAEVSLTEDPNAQPFIVKMLPEKFSSISLIIGDGAGSCALPNGGTINYVDDKGTANANDDVLLGSNERLTLEYNGDFIINETDTDVSMLLDSTPFILHIIANEGAGQILPTIQNEAGTMVLTEAL